MSIKDKSWAKSMKNLIFSKLLNENTEQFEPEMVEYKIKNKLIINQNNQQVATLEK